MDFQNIYKTIKLLLVEDNPGDVDLTLMALKNSKSNLDITTVTDGEQALDYIFKRGEFKNEESPDLIILDLNLPRVDGFSLLATIKNDKTMCHIPIIVLTTSKSEHDILKAYKTHANCVVTKPNSFTKFKELISYIDSFWFETAKLPKE